MEVKTIKLTEVEIMDIYHGLIIAMKQLDLYKNGKGSDSRLADRLESISRKLEKQSRKTVSKST